MLANSDVNIFVNRDKCFVCGICVDRCIMDNLRMYLPSCRDACPIHMNCQGYVRLIAQGKEEEAAKEMRKDMPFAGIVGRVCNHPCEERCERRKEDNRAVHIRALKRYLSDSYSDIAWEPTLVTQKTGKKVAVVGSGPAGLMAAHDLAVKGHSVTVFDSASSPGGMLRWGIPSFRLPASEVANAISMLEKMGVAFKTDKALGVEFDCEQLDREWDGILLAMGGGPPAHLGIPGEKLTGVFQGLDLLYRVRGGNEPKIGNSVIVIGGGNTAVDAALTCRKLGARDVSLVCLEERDKMPAFVEEIDEAVEEGIKIQNCWGPRIIRENEDGELTVEMSKCLRIFNEQGLFCPELEDSRDHFQSAETVIVAIGQRPDFSCYPAELQPSGGERLLVDSLTLQSKRPKFFAAGDAVTGPKSVIDAMAQGRESAISIDRYLSGDTLRWGRTYGNGATITEFSIDRSRIVHRPRAALKRIPVGERNINDEVERTMDEMVAREEAERCLNCGKPAEVNQTCWYCLPCEIECPVDALEVRLPYLVR